MVLVELRNLRALVDEHKKTCRDVECRISVAIARMTAARLVPLVEVYEREKAEEILRGWPW